jgi:uncharacterized protein (DUF433 family)
MVRWTARKGRMKARIGAWMDGDRRSHHDSPVTLAVDIYAGRRPEDVPAYSLPEAATLTGIPLSTIRSWVIGRSFPARSGKGWSQRAIQLPKGERRFLSFTNLVEVHVLAAMRRNHSLSLDAVRKAVRYVHKELDVEHPLATEEFKTNGVDLFVERLGKIINASREGQLGMKEVLTSSLARIEYDDQGRAVRLFPSLRRADSAKSIVIDPRRAFGRPVLVGTAVPIADVRARFDAGDSVEELSQDFDVPAALIEDALRAAPQAA